MRGLLAAVLACQQPKGLTLTLNTLPLQLLLGASSLQLDTDLNGVSNKKVA